MKGNIPKIQEYGNVFQHKKHIVFSNVHVTLCKLIETKLYHFFRIFTMKLDPVHMLVQCMTIERSRYIYSLTGMARQCVRAALIFSSTYLE